MTGASHYVGRTPISRRFIPENLLDVRTRLQLANTMLRLRLDRWPDVIVVGADAVGAWTALHLAKQRVRVHVVEKEREPATAHIKGARFVREPDNAGRVNLELAGALIPPHDGRDGVMQPGDSLDIPEYNPTVRVIGAVNSPTRVLYRRGAGLDYYIGNAGGYTRDADKGRVSVRYANGTARVKSKFLFFSSEPKPGPGSSVFVPAKPASEPVNITQLFGSIAQILASTVAIIVVATR